jgi:hypothetical protein
MYDPKLRDLPAQIARWGTYDYYSAPVHNSPDERIYDYLAPPLSASRPSSTHWTG